MGDDQQDPGELDDVLAELRRRVALRRAAGEFPDGLEDDLDRHFRNISARSGPKLSSEDLERAVASVRAAADFGRHRFPRDQSRAVYDLAHRTVTKALGHEIDAVFDQVKQFSDRVNDALDALATAVDDPPRHTHADLLGSLYALEDRLAAIERRLALDTDPYVALSARLDELESRLGARPFTSPLPRADIEAAQRGGEVDVAARYGDLVERLAAHAPVLDIGSGSAELLAMLRDRGVAAEGVEIDADLVRDAQARGLVVHHTDGVAHLTRLPEASLGAITAIHLVEHLQPQQLIDLVELAASRLAEGGRLVIETPNVQSLYVHAHSFWLDPTHVRLVHPLYLKLLAEHAGFRDVEITYGSPPPDDARLLEVPSDVPGSSSLNENIARLNRLLFEAQDVRVIASR